MIDLSIIIVSFNTKELLRQCLESVISDQWLVASDERKKTPITNHQPPATEIIVVDNGSNDGSQEVVKSIKSKVEREGLKLFLIENKENLGFAKAVNQGIKKVQGKAIFLLNSDTKIKKDTLEKLLQFERKVGPAIIGARMLNPDGSIQASVFNLPTPFRAIQEYWLGKKGNFSKYFPLGNQPREVEAVNGGAMLISRKVVEIIGLFDERYFMYFEDLDYCRRARRAGFRIWYLPQAEVVHEHGASGKNLASSEDQWRRLIPSSKIYHGIFNHWLITQIIRVGQILKLNVKNE